MPVTLRMATARQLGFGAQHSQCVENWFLNIPGLKLCLPATPADAYSAAAGRDPRRRPRDRVRAQGALRPHGRARRPAAALPIGRAEVVRAGTRRHGGRDPADAPPALEAAAALDARGDRGRGDRPAHDRAARRRHRHRERRRTGRLACVQESPPAGSWGQAVIAECVTAGFELLDAPPLLVRPTPCPCRTQSRSRTPRCPVSSGSSPSCERSCRRERRAHHPGGRDDPDPRAAGPRATAAATTG